jgi:glycosyltransferase involved in cell wall biosynthesis
MACILKLPHNQKGIITFTSQEQLHILSNNNHETKALKNKIKKKFFVGQHLNWPDFDFTPENDFYDFYICPSNSIKSEQKINLVNLTASDFVSKSYFPSINKSWDTITITRIQPNKNILFLLKVLCKVIKKLPNFKALIVASYDKDLYKDHYDELLSFYNQNFSVFEQQRCNLIVLESSYPFPFDTETLANFVRSSKVYLNPSKVESGGRVNTLALASGLPIICFKNITLMFNEIENKSPLIKVVGDDNLYQPLIEKTVFSYDFNYYSKESKYFSNRFSEILNSKKLLEGISHYCDIKKDLLVTEKFNLKNLDIRLARHHGLGVSINHLPMSINALITYIESESGSNRECLTINTYQDLEASFTSCQPYSYNKELINKANFPIGKFKKKSLLYRVNKVLFRSSK